LIYLLDAHAVLWWLADDPQLSAAARSAIHEPNNEVLVSAATVWEIEIKRALGKLEAPTDLVTAIEASDLGQLPVTLRDGAAAASLPPHHRDPFDRMLVAQAARLGAIVISRDGAFDAYRLERLAA
jgi:PIN domain nuclease of toxin-antitoxin system